MTINTTLSAQEQTIVQNAVNLQNAKNTAENGRTASSELGKDDFLKLLITQLQNQDPTSPMENTEFIAQMAQFSSLEQMTNMSTSFTQLANTLSASEASTTVGKRVEVQLEGATISGVVEAATRGQSPMVQINGNFYDLEKISKIYAN
ncbi:MAG: flagellar hook assembly protein FlgD [Spirochaetaceae bacterium]|jgi:flagellar basal-body rod modification protein FlgD|nr:flagellar hook assembly protein FlgD [Spirochaetaceae bacterium]